MAGINVKFKMSLKNNIKMVEAALRGKLNEAKENLSDESVEWIHDKMLNGYNEPHGADGHTEIWMTGDLYGSIQSKPEGGLTGFKINVGTDVDYASYVHNGTRKLNGRPFIRDAMMDNIDKIQDIIKDSIKGG